MESVRVVDCPEKTKFHLYLLMGQSNMAGRGEVQEEDRTPNRSILTLNRDNQWTLAVDPLHWDKENAGVGPGLSFARVMLRQERSVTIGLIPCAVGGTPLARWEMGADLYAQAVARARKAMQYGVMKGVLWHQGESDSVTEGTARTYAPRLDRMIRDLREDLEIADIPFLVGELGEFRERDERAIYLSEVNQALGSIPALVRLTACVEAYGLKDKGDSKHFSSEAQRELGRRYAEAMVRLLVEKRVGRKCL